MVTTENSLIIINNNNNYQKKMASLEFGVHQIKQFTTDTLVLFLSKHGISQSGLKALRDNQVEGEMLLEFTDADLKDIFEVFKDRFLIRKLLRGLYGPNNNPCRMGRTIATPVATTQVAGTPSVPSTIISSSPSPSSSISTAASIVAKMNSPMVTNRLPAIHSELQNAIDSYTKISTQSHLKKDPYLSTAVTAIESLPSRVKIGNNIVRVYPSSISNHEKITSRLIAAGASRSTTIPVTNSNNIAIYTVPKTLETQTTPIQSSNIKPHIIEDDDDDDDITDNDVHVIDGWGASLIKDYSAEELLRRKMRRGRPTEAQRLGRSLLREAATTANIWNTAPPLKMITGDKKVAFFNYICRAAPQLSRHKQFVWIRLGEALQNRRKYLCDKECGRRTTKRTRDSDINMVGSHLLAMPGSIPTRDMISAATTNTYPYALASSPISISVVSSAPAASHSTPLPSPLPLASSVKSEVEPIIIEADSLPNLQDSAPQTPTGSPIETINLTTLIKEEVESEEMKCWSET